MAHLQSVVGIDVSKLRLDCHGLPGEQERQVANDAAGQRALAEWLRSLSVELAVLEASGGYEQAVVTALRRSGFAVRVVDPKRVRHYAKAVGRLAKNDRIDARMIAQFATVAVATERCAVAADPARERLGMVLGARQDLIAHRTALLQQATAAGPARRALAAAVKAVARQITRLDRLIADEIAGHPGMAALARRLGGVPGLGPVATAAIIAWLPELGRLSRREVAALVGVAPFDDDSGKRRGQRSIQGGRAKLRNLLYMATLGAATQHNPVLNAFYLRLLAKGKEPKVALIACLRKLLVMLNAMIAREQDWQPRMTA